MPDILDDFATKFYALATFNLQIFVHSNIRTLGAVAGMDESGFTQECRPYIGVLREQCRSARAG